MTEVFLLADMADELVRSAREQAESCRTGLFLAAIMVYERCRSMPEPEEDGEGHWHAYWEGKIDNLESMLSPGPVRAIPLLPIP